MYGLFLQIATRYCRNGYNRLHNTKSYVTPKFFCCVRVVGNHLPLFLPYISLFFLHLAGFFRPFRRGLTEARFCAIFLSVKGCEKDMRFR